MGKYLVAFMLAAPLVSGAGATTPSETPNSLQTAQSAQTKFDGKWHAVIKGEGARCSDTFETDLTIENGDASGTIPSDIGDLRLAGKVRSDGDLRDLVASYRDFALYFTGRITGDKARGTYALGNTCDGVFTFTRK